MMPKRPGIDAAGALHHVMVRGIERIEVFSEATPATAILWSDWLGSWRIQRQKGALFCQVKNRTAPVHTLKGVLCTVAAQKGERDLREG
jgi:hypothetical protein